MSANSDTAEAPEKRGPGRPKGSRNYVTREIKTLAQRKGPRAFREMWKLALEAKAEPTRVAALTTVLQYAYGKPVAPTELTGKDGEPLHPAEAMSDHEAATRLAFMFYSAAVAKAEADGRKEPFQFRSLVQASAFLLDLPNPNPDEVEAAATDRTDEGIQQLAKAHHTPERIAAARPEPPDPAEVLQGKVAEVMAGAKSAENVVPMKPEPELDHTVYLDDNGKAFTMDGSGGSHIIYGSGRPHRPQRQVITRKPR